MTKIVLFRDCDNCGSPTQDADEIMCRKCKPSLAVVAEAQECVDKINAAYWAFSRQARALPPSMAVPEAYNRLAELGYRYYYGNLMKREAF